MRLTIATSTAGIKTYKKKILTLKKSSWAQPISSHPAVGWPKTLSEILSTDG